VSAAHRSIRQRLQRTVVLTMLIALALALVVNEVLNVLALREAQLADLSTQADLLGRMTAPALAFDDPMLAIENLSSLAARRQVRAAAVYDQAGTLVASYVPPGEAGRLPPKPGPAQPSRQGGYLEIFRPVERDGEFLGTVFLRAEEGLAALVLQRALMALMVGGGALGIALLFVGRLSRVVTRPLADIAQAAHEVVQEGDYSRRVVKHDDDELGALIDSFNAMLAEVQRSREGLEARVRERTALLEESNRELALTKARADEANQAKSNFLATMSHEIRTPMNGVIGMLDVLQQTSLSGHQVEMVGLIRESAFSLLTIIDDVLDFSKIEANRLEIDFQPIDLADVVEKACELLDGLALRKDVEFTSFVDPQIPGCLLGDALRLRQVLVNLVNNAIKFSSGREHPGRVGVRAYLVQRDARSATFEIMVSDNGIGIDEETKARLFTAFTQADSTTTRRFGGTGLGLAISRRLVELMGGDISVQSEPEQGAVFTVHLTLAVVDSDHAAPPGPLLSANCLVIGGEGGLGPDLAAYLQGAGARVERVASLPLAFAAMRGLSPGRWIWVIDGAQTKAALDGLRRGLADLREHDVRLVAIGRGPRRNPLLVGEDLVLVDGNVMTRRRLAKAVALAMGLKFDDPETASASRPGSAFRAPSRAQAVRDGRLILVAEDNDTNQNVILRQLALLGYAADVADNGSIAFQRWRSGEYALVLTDLHMPEMDGYELTAAIRAEEQAGQRTPILALTANALKGEAERCRAAGMNNYLSKPLQLADLKAALEEWLPHDGLRRRPVDTGVLESLVGDDPDVIAGFLASFRRSLAEIAQQMERALESGEYTEVGALAHKLKSSAHTIGATRLAGICARMEAAGVSENVADLQAARLQFRTEQGLVLAVLGDETAYSRDEANG
jgi:two-component system sensor histidine kinase/response regulator